MNRFFIRFTKEDRLKYISHLDMMRLFDRTIKRAGLRLAYSKGFNPHPKMSIAQPLALGCTSIGEYLEIETEASIDPALLADRLNAALPEGVRIIRCCRAADQGKSLAALVTAGRYRIRLPLTCLIGEADIHALLEKDVLIVQKHQKKTGKDLAVDIRPMILELKKERSPEHVLVEMLIATGSAANLNPEVLMGAIAEQAGIAIPRHLYSIERLDLYYSKDGMPVSLNDLID